MDATHGAPAWLKGIEQSGLGRSLREGLWFYPTVEIIHILGFVLLIGGIAVYDLRLLGLGRKVPADLLARIALPTAITGFCLAIPAGGLLLTTEATAIAGNPAFQLKMVLIGLGLINAATFHFGIYRRVAEWNLGPPPLAARLAGGMSLVLWIGVLVCGRLIAYL